MAGKRCLTDKSLGMDRRIARRDFLNGIAVAIGSIGTRLNGAGPLAAQADESWPQEQTGYYPPLLNGLRGDHCAATGPQADPRRCARTRLPRCRYGPGRLPPA
jgi:hypothetical protein